MSRTRVLLAIAASWLTGAVTMPLRAQPLPPSLPTPEQARDLVQTRPDLVAQLRQRIQSSGLSPSQIRDRLRNAGYPESLLDQVMGTASPSGTTVPGDSLIGAARQLGIVDSTDAAVLRRLQLQSRQNLQVRQAMQADNADSLGALGEAGGSPAETRPSAATFAADGSTLFGYTLFAQPTTLFDANAAGPVDASYKLGAGDQLVLILSGDVEAAYTLEVTREGFVVIPVVGTIPVANLTLGDLEVLLKNRLQRVYSGVGSTTRFSLSVARLRSNQIYVVGDVLQPGSYRISSAGTALSALYAAGGPSDRGSLRRVEIRRRGKPPIVFDVYDYLIRGDASGDARLENGDVLFVPTHGARVRITGGVLRPATYELQSGELLADVVQAAGGFTDDASRRRIRIERIVPPSQRTAEGSDRIVLDVTVPDAPLTGHVTAVNAIPSVVVEAGDLVDVPRVSSRVRHRITVTGNVWQSGKQGISAGTTLSDAIARAGGLKPDTYLGSVIVTRLRADSTREQLRATLRGLDGRTVDPLLLQEDDEVTVYSLTEFRAPQFVAVSGAIRRPGQYAYRDGMTMRDLVLQAGGLLPSASLTEAEIARLPNVREEGRLSRTFRTRLDSSYVFGSSVASVSGSEVRLDAYDNILILREPDYQLQSAVTLTGELKFPGVYALTSKTEQLSDLIQRAGGLTASAFPAGVAFHRDSGGLGRVGVDLPSVLRNRKDRDNLLLLDGDSIHVPRYNALVQVVGAVNSSVSVPYQPGAQLSYYIQAAGGSTRTADVKSTYVQQANGKVETRRRQLILWSSTPTPGPGSRVVVPARDPNLKRDITQLLGTTAQVLGSLLTVIVVLTRSN